MEQALNDFYTILDWENKTRKTFNAEDIAKFVAEKHNVDADIITDCHYGFISIDDAEQAQEDRDNVRLIGKRLEEIMDFTI